MAGGEDHGVRQDFLAGGGEHAADVVSGDEEIGDLGLEADFAAGGEDRVADGLDDVGQQVGADVRVGVGEDLLGRAVGDEDFVNLGDGAALGGAGVELAIGKRAGAALAEAVVGLLDHAAFAQQGGEVEAAGAGVLAALQQDGFQAVFETAQRGEHARPGRSRR